MVLCSFADGKQLCIFLDLQVLQELASDKALERFRIEYEKLYKALKKSHGNPGCSKG